MDKQTIVLCGMILMAMLTMFAVGYYVAYGKAVNHANQFVYDNCVDKPISIPKDRYEFNFDFNYTIENDTGQLS